MLRKVLSQASEPASRDAEEARIARHIEESMTSVARDLEYWVLLLAVVAVVLLVVAFRRRAFAGRAHPTGVFPTLAGVLLAAFAFFAFHSIATVTFVIGGGEGRATPSAALVAGLATSAGLLLLARRGLGLRPEVFGVHGRGPVGAMAFGLLVYLAALPVFYLLMKIELFPRKPQTQVLDIAASTDFVFLALYAVTVSVAVPLFEELLFRGVLFPVLRRRLGVVAGILSSAIFFMLVHESQTWLPIFWLGAVLAFSYHYSGSLFAPLLIHAVHNTFQFALLLAVS